MVYGGGVRPVHDSCCHGLCLDHVLTYVCPENRGEILECVQVSWHHRFFQQGLILWGTDEKNGEIVADNSEGRKVAIMLESRDVDL